MVRTFARNGLPDGLTVESSRAPGASRSTRLSGTGTRSSTVETSTIPSTAVGGVMATYSPALFIRAVITPSKGARTRFLASWSSAAATAAVACRRAAADCSSPICSFSREAAAAAPPRESSSVRFRSATTTRWAASAAACAARACSTWMRGVEASSSMSTSPFRTRDPTSTSNRRIRPDASEESTASCRARSSPVARSTAPASAWGLTILTPTADASAEGAAGRAVRSALPQARRASAAAIGATAMAVFMAVLRR